MADYPVKAVRAAAAAMCELHDLDPRWAEVLAKAALNAAAPALERHVHRQTARRILELDALDHQRTHNRGPYYDMRTSLRRLERGEPLPEPAGEQAGG